MNIHVKKSDTFVQYSRRITDNFIFFSVGEQQKQQY